MAMTLAQFKTNIRLGLSDSATFWSDAEIARAVERTEYLLDRLIPKKAIVETTITIDRDGETLNIASSAATTTYKPVKYSSETITRSGTTYVRDTDYTINYMTGAITEIGSQMPDQSDYAITYKQDTQRLDVSSLISTNAIKITRVEYPVGDIPPTFLASYDLIEDYIILHKDTTLTEDKHLRIHYDTPWTKAVSGTAGEYPGHLADAIVIGAMGFCLIIKAEKYVQSSITELELVNTAADSMATPLADINDALDKVALYLETNDTTDNAKDVLANITDDAAELRTAIETALDESTNLLVHASTDPSAKYYLTQGDDKIITVNVADRVAEKYADYARASIQIYNSLIAEATVRLSNLRSYMEEAAGWTEMGDTFIKEATQRIAEVNGWAIQADRYRATSQEYLNIAGGYLASGQAKINEFYVMLGFKPELQHVSASTAQATRY